jgi:hypothetical protein
MALTKVSTGVVDLSGSTGALEIAKGTWTERCAISSPTIGLLRSNTTDNTMEVYTSAGWKVLKEGIPSLTVDYLVVAGGGGGGSAHGASGAGGGAGEYLSKTAQSLVVSTAYTITIGAGGAGGSGNSPATGRGIQGSNSVFIETTRGGGFGRVAGGSPLGVYAGSDGGSGGGGTWTGAGGASTAVSPGLGYAGGSAVTTPVYGSGGGGGAGAAGLNGTTTTGGNGGSGVTNSITVASGTGPYYAAGGGGGVYQNTNVGIGGNGIGGSSNYGNNATPGSANTGSGGGGGTYSGIVGLGGAGGSGVVVIKYSNAFQTAFTSGGGFVSTQDTTTSPGYTIKRITAGSGTITFSLKP